METLSPWHTTIHLISFQLVAASCAGNLGWMKALLRVGADPNEVIISDIRDETLTAYHGCMYYAPRDQRLDCLKLLLANGSKVNPRAVLEWKPVYKMVEEGYTDILEWLNISDEMYQGNTDLHMAIFLCDQPRINEILRAGWDDKYSRLHSYVQFFVNSCLLCCPAGIPGRHITNGTVKEGSEVLLFRSRNGIRSIRCTTLKQLSRPIKSDVGLQQMRCLDLLLLYGVALKESYFESLIIGVPPLMLYKLHVAGLPGLDKVLQRISEFRIKLDANGPGQPNLSNILPPNIEPKSMTYDQYTCYLWRRVFGNKKLRALSDQHYASIAGTSPKTLQEICCEAVRKCLINNNEQNLFVIVPNLPLTLPTKEILLYGEKISKTSQRLARQATTFSQVVISNQHYTPFSQSTTLTSNPSTTSSLSGNMGPPARNTRDPIPISRLVLGRNARFAKPVRRLALGRNARLAALGRYTRLVRKDENENAYALKTPNVIFLPVSSLAGP